MQDAVIPMASPSLISLQPALAKPSDLAQWRKLRTPLERWTSWFRAAGLDWPERQSTPKLVSLGLTLEASVSGQGVLLARPSLARAWVASGALKPVFRVTALPVHGYNLMPFEVGGTAQEFAAWAAGGGCVSVSREQDCAWLWQRATLPNYVVARASKDWLHHSFRGRTSMAERQDFIFSITAGMPVSRRVARAPFERPS